MSSNELSLEVSGQVIGFLGCGKISSALCRGFASQPIATRRPAKILVSRRSEAKSRCLQEEFPDLIEVSDSNEDIVRRSNVIFLGLLPAAAESELPHLPFTTSHLIISMMAALNFETTRALLPRQDLQLVRTVPLPSCARRQGPILQYPAHKSAESLLKFIGTPVVCKDEEEMKPMIAVTGHISSFYELMRTSEGFLEGSGEYSDLCVDVCNNAMVDGLRLRLCFVGALL
jgi:pyrroline-5-carboxylate reductase